MDYTFLVVWSGGYESNRYASAPDRTAAFAKASEWVDEGLVEGDSIDILSINTRTGTVQVTNVA